MSTPTLSLKELDQQREAQRSWIRERDRLTEAVSVARGRLASLEQKLAQPEPGLDALKEMLSRVDQVPGDLTSRSTQFQPGGFNLRDTLRGMVSNGLDQVSARRKQMEEALPEAQRKVADIELALERHTGKAVVHAGAARARLDEFRGTGTGAVR